MFYGQPFLTWMTSLRYPKDVSVASVASESSDETPALQSYGKPLNSSFLKNDDLRSLSAMPIGNGDACRYRRQKAALQKL